MNIQTKNKIRPINRGQPGVPGDGSAGQAAWVEGSEGTTASQAWKAQGAGSVVV